MRSFGRCLDFYSLVGLRNEFGLYINYNMKLLNVLKQEKDLF